MNPQYEEVLNVALDAIQLLRIAGHDPTADFLLERLIKNANIGGGSNATV
tara:strand:+ start:3364 stop:3513 length:150 start_codon:yes stop_codon:yes gene_type:complete